MIHKEQIFDFGHGREAPEVTVGISLYNYGGFVGNALRSVYRQTLGAIELIVVDDASMDEGPDLVLRWLQRNGIRFSRALLVRKIENEGLAAVRNRAIELALAPFFFVLDADNAIYPRCLERLSVALRQDASAAFAYPIIEVFGEERGLMGTSLWSRDRLALGNYIDAMALIRREHLVELGGYPKMDVPGWEDYSLWCRFSEQGLYGIRVPEILARYRAHGVSMLNTITRRKERLPKLLAEMMERHPWLRLAEERL